MLLLPLFIINDGTGLENPVVWYNEAEFMGIKMLTIPLEDAFYGMELILLNLIIYRALLNRNSTKNLLRD